MQDGAARAGAGQNIYISSISKIMFLAPPFSPSTDSSGVPPTSPTNSATWGGNGKRWPYVSQRHAPSSPGRCTDRFDLTGGAGGRGSVKTVGGRGGERWSVTAQQEPFFSLSQPVWNEGEEPRCCNSLTSSKILKIKHRL